eukprot:Gb_17324 [translate_table: standard]
MSACSSDGEEKNGDLQDWEILPPPKLGPPLDLFGSFDDVSEGLIDPNYFAHPSLAQKFPNYRDDSPFVEDETSGVRSPSDSSPSNWIDPSSPRVIVEAEYGSPRVVDEERPILRDSNPRPQVAEEPDLQQADVDALVVGPPDSVWEHGFEEAEQGALGTKSDVWWKIPMGVWKIKVGQVGTLWTFAMVAAAMGVVVLGRRWYRVKCQNKKLRLQVNSDNKRISQLMFQAVRLSEAFSAVRRVPIFRPPIFRPQISFGGCHDVV